jgi:gliding motility-associated-like protein
MYWNNGAKWTNIYGVTDALEKTVAVETVHVGQYEARSVERVSGFKFDVSGISNRRITPNGDGLNDRIQFRFDNPADAQVSGRIFDLKGAYVAGMTQTGQFTIEWDGKAGGQPVSGGVYIYQLECEGDVFTGTLAVVR